MKNYFIIHGTFGHNQENWFPWLESELKKKGCTVYNLNYPTPEGQTFENWSKVLNEYKDKITDETVFICHSIGCVFLAKYCIYNKIKIGKAIFVSGCNNYYFMPQFDEINKYMYTDRISEFKDYCSDVVCFLSKDDPYITFDELKKFANSVYAKQVVKENAGHFNEKAGFKKFEEILKYVDLNNLIYR